MPVGVVREAVLSTLREVLEDARAAGDLKLTTLPALVLDIPKKNTWGDLATTVAMNLSASERRAPREIAEIIAGRLRAHSDVLERIDVAPPGYINLTIRRDLWFRVLAEIEAQGEHYGRSTLGLGKRILLEFVSANPTGPLHMGHGRGAALGGALANLLHATGYEVTTEYYINDAGRQMRLLAESVEARYRQLLGDEAPLPEDGYRGLYVKEIAKRLLDKRRTSGEPDVPPDIGEICRRWAYAQMLDGIKADLSAFGLQFDTWLSESSLFDSGAVEQSLEMLRAAGYLFEQDGAQWFRSTAFGDDKDRVVRKQDGEYTYLASDIAYHRDKLARGYDLLINIWGADHHGYIPRMQAAVEAFGYPKDRLKVILVQIVNLLRGGQRVTMSKRAGEMVTLREVVEEVGADAAKFIFLTRRADSQLDFDLELAKQQSAENPVYYVQYAHARVASLFRVAAEREIAVPATGSVDWTVLNSPDDLELIKPLAEYPALLEASAQALEPHRLTYYLQDLAARLHAYYYKHRILPPMLERELDSQDHLKPVALEAEQGRKGETLTPALTAARLCLFRSVQTVIRNGLGILGVTAPERM
ncbi:MAG: arginine--tRNA ligase [Nitrospirae bacterium]|nr:arginine--tRNA ligase [Nitrospirota bacterium]